jgi:hypothetical protein
VEVLTFPGRYQDQAGSELIRWRVEGSRRYKLPSLDFYTTTRGVDLWGVDFDGLEPADPAAAAGRLPLNQAGELSNCVLPGDLPCTLAVGERRPATIIFTLDMRRHPERRPGSASLTLALVLDNVPYQWTRQFGR